jgi:hypothetical protein
MHTGRYIFSQIIDFLPERDFRKIVEQYQGDYKSFRLSCWDQFLAFGFAQLTFTQSLRDLEDCLRPRAAQLYHLGFRGSVARSTLADANASRDWRIYQDFALLLIAKARKLYAGDPIDIEDLDSIVYAIDSTTVDLCLALFPWAHFRKKKGAIKIHTQIELRGPIPTMVYVTDGKVHDVNWLDAICFEAGCFYLFDRGYIAYDRLYRITDAKAFFVTRAKSDFHFYRCHSQPVQTGTGVVADQVVVLPGVLGKKKYPAKLRRIVFIDPEKKKRLVFLTNNFVLPALTLAKLYKARWRIELFFKWLKSNLRIKTFLGHDQNAVKIQVWIAITIYTLLLIIRKQLNLKPSMHTILTVLSLNIFEQAAIQELFTELGVAETDSDNPNQLAFNY